jgi:ribonuclease BN (tRNA processing enzyme)
VRVRVLGCHGGELPGLRTSCFLVNGRATVDAGALCQALEMPRLLEVDDIFLTHSHFDHVKDVPLIADLLAGKRETPVRVRGPAGTIESLQRDVFNNRLWPDFTRIPNAQKPVVQLEPMNGAVEAAGARFSAVPVTHPVDACAYLVSDGRATVVFSGDTGPTTQLWQEVNRAPGLAAVFLELSFPNRMQGLADVSGHFTPQTVRVEIQKIRERKCPVFLYHLKPAFLDELKREVAAMKMSDVRVLSQGDEFEF